MNRYKYIIYTSDINTLAHVLLTQLTENCTD